MEKKGGGNFVYYSGVVIGIIALLFLSSAIVFVFLDVFGVVDIDPWVHKVDSWFGKENVVFYPPHSPSTSSDDEVNEQEKKPTVVSKDPRPRKDLDSTEEGGDTTDNFIVRELKFLFPNFVETMRDGPENLLPALKSIGGFFGGKLAWIFGVSDLEAKVAVNIGLGILVVVFIFVSKAFYLVASKINIFKKKQNEEEGEEKKTFWEKLKINLWYGLIIPVFGVLGVIPIVNQVFRILTLEFLGVSIFYRAFVIAIFIVYALPLVGRFMKYQGRKGAYNEDLKRAKKEKIEEME